MLTLLLLPTALASATQVALQSLQLPEHTDLNLDAQEIQWAGGTVVRFHQSLNGIEVLGTGPRVSLDPTDRVLRTRGTPLKSRPTSLHPSVSSQQAIKTAQDALRIDPSNHLWAPYSKLAIDPSSGAHLVWVVDLGRANPLQTWQAHIDAIDGRIRHAEITSKSTDGWVFPESPAHSEPELTELLNLTSNERIAGTYAEAFSCVEWDIDPKPFGQRDCLSIEPTASPDLKGNYRYAPMYGALEDPFAEVQAYHHTDRISSWADEMWGIRGEEPIRVLTNFPLTNAFYGDFDGDGKRDVSYGISDDGLNFAYDSDVVYHEYGHAIVRMVAGSMGTTADSIGMNWTTGALNEGTADIFAMLLNEDPLLAEYLGQSDRWDKAIRDLEPDKYCPGDLQSQVHRSGEILGSVGWNLIEALGTEATAELLMGALSTWSIDTSWSDAGESLVQAAQDLHSVGFLGPEELQAAISIIDASGMPDCDRVIDLSSGRVSKQYMLNLGLNGEYTNFPTGVQMKLLAPPEATSIQFEIVDFDGKADGTGWTIYISAGEPVQHTPSRVEGFGLAFAEVSDFDLKIDGDQSTATIRIDETSDLPLHPGEVYYLAVASRNLSRAPLDIDYASISIAGSIHIGREVDDVEVSQEGCSTAANTTSHPLSLALLTWVIARRRRE